MSLPEPRGDAGTYRIALVCLGNICRSPMAEKVLTADLERAGLAGRVAVDSFGTGGWHIGSGMDDRAAATLRVHGYPTDHEARRFDPALFHRRDLLLAMDGDNLAELHALAPDGEARARTALFRSFAPGAGPNPEIPDPYYGGEDGFTAVLTMVEAAAKGLAEECADRFGPDSG